MIARVSAETIRDEPGRRLAILADRPELVLCFNSHAPDQPGADPHVHDEHTDSFHVLEGRLTLLVGPGREELHVHAGEVAVVPPGVVHGFRNDSGVPATWLNMHTPNGGFADYLRGARDGVEVAWDSREPPAGGGLPASAVTVARSLPPVEARR